MRGKETSYRSIDEYISESPPEVQEILQTLRKVIKESAPDATEKISYGMPTFYLHGNLVYFGAFKDHIGFFPTSSGVGAFKDELSEYSISKGTVRFPIEKPLPYDLIRKIVKFRVAENIKRVEDKPKRSNNG